MNRVPRSTVKRKANAAAGNASGKAARASPNFAWGSWFTEFLKNIKTKSEREEVRRGAFLVTNAYATQGRLNSPSKKAMYELTHLNASHLAGLMGLWAELAIREGIRVAQAGASARSATRGGSPTTRYTFNRPLRSPASRVNGNNLNANNNTTKSPRTVDYVMMKSDRYADRYSGISPFNFVFKNFISNKVKPWEYASISSPRRDADVTCFEKVRVDWNWVKLWCGASAATLDWEQKKDGHLYKAHSLPNHGNPTGGSTGTLTPADIAILRSGVPNIFPATMNAATKDAKIRKLKALMKFIFESELTIFKGDAKGDKSGETDGQFLRAILDASGRTVGYEFIDDELKISVGKNETYPAEDIQLLKKMILNSLFLNCDYPGVPPIRFIRCTRSFFVAFGLAALDAHITHRKITELSGRQLEPPRGPGITAIINDVRDIFNNGAIWNVYEVVPNSSIQRKLLAFPGCSFTGIRSKVLDLRNDYERNLTRFFKNTTAARITSMILDDDQRSAYMALLLLKDYNDRSRNFSSCRRVYKMLRDQLKDVLGDYLSGFKKSAFITYYEAGGGANSAAAWGRVGAATGTVRDAEPGLGRVESYFVKSGPNKSGGSRNTGAGASSPGSYLKKALKAFVIFDQNLRSEILSAPDHAQPPIRKAEALAFLMSPQVIRDIEKFVAGTSLVHVSTPRYIRRENVAASPPKAESIERRVLHNAATYSNQANYNALRARIASAAPNQREVAFLRLKNQVPEQKMRMLFANFNNLKIKAASAERAARARVRESQGSNNNMY